MGGALTAKSIPSVGGLIENVCLGVRTFEVFGRETGTKNKYCFLAYMKMDITHHVECLLKEPDRLNQVC